MSFKRIIIIGAGPAGLGAAYRLKGLGYENWVIYEKEDYVGGLSSSFKDQKGFVWDIGGHVIFSGNERFNSLVDFLIGKDFISHKRESWIRIMDRWVPYPFQNNIHHLPEHLTDECLQGLLHAQKHEKGTANFQDWIYKTFGKGIARIFLVPYNTKMWAVPLEIMSYDWINERVSIIDLEKLKKNIALKADDVDWGLNSWFRFPLHGGTGSFFNKFGPFIKDRIVYKRRVTCVDIDSRTVVTNGRYKDIYDILINTSPLDLFVSMIKSKRINMAPLRRKAEQLRHNSIYVIGIGLKKRIKGTKCWVYFSEKEIPFYRMTYFSHYSPHNVPEGNTDVYSSLMCEVSFSKDNPLGQKNIVDLTIRGLINAGILSKSDTRLIVSKFLKKIDYAYPIPTLGRNDILRSVQPFLEKNAIYSRGRFGAWKYEIGNMDHSTMMGIELIDRLLKGKEEQIWTR